MLLELESMPVSSLLVLDGHVGEATVLEFHKSLKITDQLERIGSLSILLGNRRTNVHQRLLGVLVGLSLTCALSKEVTVVLTVSSPLVVIFRSLSGYDVASNCTRRASARCIHGKELLPQFLQCPSTGWRRFNTTL